MEDLPKTIGRYQIMKRLGRGSKGTVYLGRDPYIERHVAIKTYQIPESRGPKGIEKYQKKFFIEAQSAGRLMHQNIVAVYDADLFEDLCYITMEYIDGDTLERFCCPENLLSPEEATEIVFHVCNGLEYAHQNGVIHRDIKPSNIMLTSAGQPKITDFSIAFMKKGESTLVQGLFGSPSYMSPEQIKEEEITEQTDIFSLGLVLYELLAGRKAFEGNNDYAVMYKIVNEEPLPILDIKPELPKIFGEMFSKALAKDLSQRYKNSMDFAYDLRLALLALRDTTKETYDRELLEYISSLAFFSDFTEDHINEILSASNLIKVEENETIIQEGEIDDSFYILISGEVLVQKKRKKVAVLEKGQCFGEMAYLTGEPRSASIITNSECILLKFSSTLLNKLSESIQLLFFKKFTTTIIKRLSKSN
ncbi:MAG TPA: serine/threonine-protein kinase [Desulfatiglandales bacterium]|nr:serine/threonine-protein kinase [Desulfatiglandales bacterium]